MNPLEVYCSDCYWEGVAFDLECSDEDVLANLPVK